MRECRFSVAVAGIQDEPYRQAYYAAWPESREHRRWENLAYWRVMPRWARYSDYDRGPLTVEFHWDTDPRIADLQD